MKNLIRFRVIEGIVSQDITTYEGEYRNLMFLLADQIYLESFGECGGLGRCATCIVKVTGSSAHMIAKERNEPITLSKAGHEAENTRLSCQIYINERLDGATIEIL